MTLHLVLDTNVWLDWLVFADACVAPIRTAVEQGRAKVYIDQACEAELARVLGYPLGRTQLDSSAQAACLAECRKVARASERATPLCCVLPPCSDPDDQKFLELARDCGADLLVTKDRELLVLARHAPFRIVTPHQAGEALA